VSSIMQGRTLRDDSPIRPAEYHWHMVFVRKDGEVRVVFVGPWTTAGVAHYAERAEILWIKFKLGAFMPHLPAGRFLDTETILPGASSRTFWLKGSAWGFPDTENAETLVDRLVRNGVLTLFSHRPVAVARLMARRARSRSACRSLGRVLRSRRALERTSDSYRRGRPFGPVSLRPPLRTDLARKRPAYGWSVAGRNHSP
jgi:hypothetical protein